MRTGEYALRKVSLSLAFLILVLTASLQVSCAVEYRMHVLDDMPGMSFSCALDINKNGLVVGSSSYDTGMHMCYWDASGVHDLHYGLGTTLSPMAVNSAGTVTTLLRVWSNETWSKLPTLIAPPYGTGELYDINQAGNIVGAATINTSMVYHACLWNSTGAHDLGVLPSQTSSTAYGLNDNGQIVGISGNKAFIWQNNVMSPIDGVPSGYFSSSAWRINNLGQVIGSCTEATQWGARNVAFTWQNHNWAKLGIGSWETFAKDMNDAGQIVGYYSDLLGGVRSAFVSQNGETVTLPGLGSDTFAYGINGDGWIVGHAVTADRRHYEAVVWEPVPEPSCVLVLLGGLGMVFGRARRKMGL